MNRYHVLAVTGGALCTSLICASPACAYLDPGTGSMIVQALIAAFAAVSVSVGIFWKRLKSIFSRDKGETPGDK